MSDNSDLLDTKPTRPRVTDPDMVPLNSRGQEHLESKSRRRTKAAPRPHHEPEVYEDYEDPPEKSEKNGLFTTVYENKLMVVIIVLVVIIIGIIAYMIVRKSADEPDDKNPQNH